MNEGGQSSTGQLIDFMVTTHPAYPKLLKLAEETKKSWFDILAERLEGMRVEKGVSTTSEYGHTPTLERCNERISTEPWMGTGQAGQVQEDRSSRTGAVGS